MSKQGIFLSIADNQEGKSPTIITRDNRLPTIDLGNDIARGKVAGAYQYAVFGQINAIAGEESIIWETGMPSSFTVPDNIQLTLVSSSASDTGSIKIKYLDGDLIAQEEEVQLNGTTPVLTQATDIRAINNAYSMNGAVIGNITISNSGTMYAYIPAGDMQFNTTLQRVPAGKRLMIHSIYAGSASGSASAKAIIKLESTAINGDSFANEGYLHPLGAVATQDNSATLAGIPSFAVHAGEWVALTVLCDKDATVTGGMFGWIEDA